MIRFINPGIQPPIYLDTANQRVGIGTSSPQYVLDVKASAANTFPVVVRASDDIEIFKIQNSASGNGGVLIQNTSGSTIWFLSSGSTSYFNSSSQGLVMGNTTINAAAALQIDNTAKGFLPPRMTTTQKNAVSSPPAGLVVYDSTLNKLCVYTGAAWETVTSV